MEHLIVKLFTNTLSTKEKKELLDWLQEEDNLSVLKNYIQNDYDLNRAMLNPDMDMEFDRLIRRIETSEDSQKIEQEEKTLIPSVKRSWFNYAAAASVAILLLSGYFFRNTFESLFIKENIVNTTIEPGNSKAILTLSDGAELVLEKGKTYTDENIHTDGEQLNYSVNENIKDKNTFNYLTIPRGGQFSLELTDGTKIWLNSDSKIKYPVQFVAGETRRVELLYGEAYFDVSPSTENKGSSFIVSHKWQDIEVLGTQFNLKAYPEEPVVYTTLVEGKVAVSNDTHKTILKPNQQAAIAGSDQAIDVSEVDVYAAIAWKDGVFNFRKKELREVVLVLTRWYNVDISIEDPALEHYEFNGLLRKNQNLEEILQLIKQTEQLTYEKKKDTKIILRKQ